MEKEFDQQAWNLKIREASAKWFEENLDYNPAYNYYDTGEITIPEDSKYYRVPIEMWYEYHEVMYNFKTNNKQ
tara:strand:+ start:206 stop:424 length:219 start_codon:yes stop_codon:yes gene_type:complete